MAARVWPVDAVTGAPSYSGRGLRQTTVSPFVAGATTARPLGGQSGVRPGTASNIATATSTLWTVTPFAGLLDGATAAIAGVYSYAFDTNQTGSVTAAGASPRTDRLDVQVVDPTEGGVAGANPLIQIVYTVGTPGLAAAPAQSHPLAQINVPTSGSPTVTWTATYAVAAGGIQPVASSTAYPSSPSVGQRVDDAALGMELRYSGSAWAGAGYGPWTTYTPTVTGITVGSGGSVFAEWRRAGESVEVHYKILLGTSGFSVGSNPTVTLPINSATLDQPYMAFDGNGAIYDSSAAFPYATFVAADNTGVTAFRIYYPNTGGAFGPITASTPVTFAASDSFSGRFIYRSV